MTPTLKYPGAKWRLAPWILEHMPPHQSYLEPYFGSGAVLFNKPRARYETVNDLDGGIVQFFRVCREQPEALASALEMTPWAREEFDDARDWDSAASEVERARRFAVRCWMSFGGRVMKNGWRVSAGSGPNPGPRTAQMWHRMPDTVRTAAQRLMDVQIECCPALEIIRRWNGPECLIYADPPYLKGTRSLHGDQYRHEMTSAAHETLLTVLKAHEGMVLLSGYWSELYQDLLPGWTIYTRKTVAERGAARTEYLWLNPQAGERRRILGADNGLTEPQAAGQKEEP